jgi:hypothetical protein
MAGYETQPNPTPKLGILLLLMHTFVPVDRTSNSVLRWHYTGKEVVG